MDANMLQYKAKPEVIKAIADAGWFEWPGAYVLVDGQYGSTGKGLLSSLLAEVSFHSGRHVSLVTSNAGPNSGHTAYMKDGRKVMAQQLPIFALSTWLNGGGKRPVYLNGGAVIDPALLIREVEEFNFSFGSLVLHPCAAVIEEVDRIAEANGGPAIIASTGKGVGSAIARKIMRERNTIGHVDKLDPRLLDACYTTRYNWTTDRVFVETSQGFSLGVNSHQFYPYTTSRECTVMQAIADARIPHDQVMKVVACYRTFPIRVGNTGQGRSGGCYPDQYETSWEELGLRPEYTSVTKRVRRVFTWSRQQFKESIGVNHPDTLFLNFMQYLKTEQQQALFFQSVVDDYQEVMGRKPWLCLLGYGPYSSNVRVVRP